MLWRHIVLVVFEIALLVLLLWAAVWRPIARRLNKATLVATVTRSDISWGYFPIAFFILFGFYGVIVASEDLAGHTKNILHTFNGLATLYLCFFNGWFRNKIVWIVGRSKSMKERQ